MWQGHVDVCEWLIETGADWRAKNSFGCNAVQWAALSGSVSMCRWLQSIGLELGLLNDNGHSALHKAAVKGQQSVCTWLLSPDGGGLGAQHMLPDGDGNTPAEMARLEGYRELGRWLESETQRLVHADELAEDKLLEADSQGRTSVHHAAKAGAPELLSRVAISELQRVDRFGRSAVHYAAQADASDGEAASALAVCCRRLQTDQATVAAADTAGCTPLHYAAMQPMSHSVKVLLCTPRAVHMSLLVAQDRGGKAALHYAAERGSASSVELMIACLQASGNGTTMPTALAQTDRVGRTPLHFAARRGKKGESVTMACLSVAAGAVVTSAGTADRSGKTPLHLLAEHSTANCVQACLDVMMKHLPTLEEICTAVDQKHRTPLHYAARNSDRGVMGAIAARCQCLTDDSGTGVAAIGDVSSLAHLLCKSVDVDGQLPVHHAARFGSAGGITACLQLMESADTGAREVGNNLGSGSAARCQLLAADRSGRLPLHYAASAYGTYKRKNRQKPADCADDQGSGTCGSPKAAAVFPCLRVDPEVAREQVLHADDEGKFPAFYAAELESADALAAILSVGAVAGETAVEQLGHHDRDGRCVMHFAARRRTPAALRVCVDALRFGPNGTDAHKRSGTPGTDLCSAVGFLHVRDRYGKVPADYASSDTVKAFLKEVLLETNGGTSDEHAGVSSSGETAERIVVGAGCADCEEEQQEEVATIQQDPSMVHVRRPRAHVAERSGEFPWDTATPTAMDAAGSADKLLVSDHVCPYGQVPALEKKSDKGSAFAEFLVRTFGTTALATGAGVLDVAGGKGELSRALDERGISSVIVDPLSCGGVDAGKESGCFPRHLRVAFNWQFGDMHGELLHKSSCLVGLHPDQPTGAIVEVALAHEKPFAVVPCCVFSSQFPERMLSGKLVRRTEDLVKWLCEQVRAAGRRPQVAALPIRGRNTVVFSMID